MSAKIIPITKELKKYGLNPQEWDLSPKKETMGKVLFFNKKQTDYYFEGQVDKNEIVELSLRVS